MLLIVIIYIKFKKFYNFNLQHHIQVQNLLIQVIYLYILTYFLRFQGTFILSWIQEFWTLLQVLIISFHYKFILYKY